MFIDGITVDNIVVTNEQSSDSTMNLQSVLVSHLLLSLPLLTIATHSTEQNISSKHIPWRQIKFISAQQWLSHSEWRHNAMPTFSAKGMDHLYMLTEWALNYIQPLSGLPLSIITDRLLDDPLPTLHQNKALVCCLNCLAYLFNN